MVEIRQTLVFAAWLASLKDRNARARIHVRLDRLALGLAGDVKPVGSGVSELRVDYGPGYRVYLQAARPRIGNAVDWWQQANTEPGYRASHSHGSRPLGKFHGTQESPDHSLRQRGVAQDARGYRRLFGSGHGGW
ncbi:MAG: type II toxin-antitoxin system RelE/ParE family toxin [Alphaproteobacteria bacterium]